MERLFRVRHFAEELNHIKNPNLRLAVGQYLKSRTPDYFWETGASSSGRYHPEFSQGVGGLVRHTKAVVMFALELLRMEPYNSMDDESKDAVIAACILHDTCKYGCEDYAKTEYKAHALNASLNFKDFYCTEFCYFLEEEMIDSICKAILCHMGHWAERPEERPSTIIDQCVHEADYIASRNFIQIPVIVSDYRTIQENILEEIENLPFQGLTKPLKYGIIVSTKERK